MRTYGLIGYPLEHSYSPDFFNKKFKEEKIKDVRYELFPLENISEFPDLIKTHPDIRGLNVTIPYKESVIKYLDSIEPDAKIASAVNTIRIDHSPLGLRLKGYNTDIYGFKTTLKEVLTSNHTKALILGSGGASKAVQFVLDTLGIMFMIVSRNPTGNQQISYKEITDTMLVSHPLIINTTPSGMFPETSEYPRIPYHALSSENILYDLIYNPKETNFIKFGKINGARTVNGIRMFKLQAEKSWEIWNNS